MGQWQLGDLAIIVQRNEGEHGSLDTVLGRGEAAVTDTVTALVRVQLGLRRLPAGIPYGISILNIQIFAVDVCRYIIVTITGQTQKLCILLKAVDSSGIGSQREKIGASQIIAPRKWRLRCGDDVLLICIIKKTKFHIVLHSAVARHIV